MTETEFPLLPSLSCHDNLPSCGAQHVSMQKHVSTQTHVLTKKSVSKFLLTALQLIMAILALSLYPKLSNASQGQYLTTDAFLALAFGKEGTPKIATLWLTPEVQKQADAILGHPFGKLRVRYWTNSKKTAWVIDEIGKVKPITTGIVISNQAIESVHILEFRESRGWEVKNLFFTDQFKNNQLTPDYRLTQGIDGISGATLSVRAVKNVARLALFFDTLR